MPHLNQIIKQKPFKMKLSLNTTESTVQEQENLVATEQNIQLVEGTFTPSEASHVITSLIDEKINFHKLKRISLCEGDETSNTDYEDQRVVELYNEMKIAKSYISQARKEGYNLMINGTLEITFVK